MRNEAAYRKYKAIEKGSLMRGIAFELTFNEYLKYYQQPCYYCDILSIGLDRICSVLSYNAQNVVPCCPICNMMKASIEQDAFLNHCKRIAFKHSQDIDNVPDSNKGGNLILSLRGNEKQLVINTLNAVKGNRTRAAKELGISTTTLWRKIKHYRINGIAEYSCL